MTKQEFKVNIVTEYQVSVVALYFTEVAAKFQKALYAYIMLGRIELCLICHCSEYNYSHPIVSHDGNINISARCLNGHWITGEG